MDRESIGILSGRVRSGVDFDKGRRTEREKLVIYDARTQGFRSSLFIQILIVVLQQSSEMGGNWLSSARQTRVNWQAHLRNLQQNAGWRGQKRLREIEKPPWAPPI